MKIPEEFHAYFWSHLIYCYPSSDAFCHNSSAPTLQSSNTYLFNSEVLVGFQRVFHLYGTAQKVPSSSQSWSNLDITMIFVFHSISKGLQGQFRNSLKLF